MKSDLAYLKRSLEMIRRVEDNTRDGRQAFLGSHLHQDAVLRNLHTLTETTQRLSPALKAENPDVEWARLAAFRNVVVHDYLGIDLALVWSVVENDLPNLKASLESIVALLGDPAKPGVRG